MATRRGRPPRDQGQVQKSVYIETATWERLEQIAEKVPFPMNTSQLLRWAIDKGVEAIEKEFDK